MAASVTLQHSIDWRHECPVWIVHVLTERTAPELGKGDYLRIAAVETNRSEGPETTFRAECLNSLTRD
ncbi:hypothetical protein EBB79_08615 [Parasedimentitalea marina]|uniref:Uncharacterized protein n=1 Tax=Parasedimentitalea marina TaxID=2483033 RepID=A0A3T0N1P9_9RHOB|nr:hypothetical protein EBB79_08615 [Parasedimentitalea marina]